MKKIAALAVLLIFLVNTMGYFFVFKCSQCLVKKEMLSNIRKGAFHPDIVLLKILHPEKETTFRRVDKNEFTFYGRLYDIVVERKCGDTTLFYCLRDKKEETLLSDFTLYLRNNGGSGSPQKDNPMLALLHNLVTQALLQNITLTPQNQGINFLFPEFQTPLVPVYLVHHAPPPKSA